jgi:hypothetical protein
MAAIPIDQTRATVLLAGPDVVAAPDYGPEDAQGKRKKIDGAQGRDKATGLPVWQINVIIMYPGAPETARVKVAAAVNPAPVLAGLAPLSPVTLVDFTGTPYGDGKVSYRATGVEVPVSAGRRSGSDAA